MHRTGVWIVFLLTVVPCLGADWSPKLAADYLDSRQKDWFAWKRAAINGGPCVSCHTGVTYLMARPALRRMLGEEAPTTYETGLLRALRARLDAKAAKDLNPNWAKEPLASQGLGVEAVFSALFLTCEGNGSLSTDSLQAFDRMWSLQIAEGKWKGSWDWFSLNDDPWEMPDSRFYGTSLAALSVANAPEAYRNQENVRPHIAAMKEYLQKERQAQPLHNRLMLLWASSKLAGLLPEPERRSIIQEILRKQQADGSWTMEALGPWVEHPNAPPSPGSNSYATAFAAFTLLESGTAASNPNAAKALDWLRSHQDRQFGYWAADSMNKVYDAGSMPQQFMRDAATSFAVLALSEQQTTRRK